MKLELINNTAKYAYAQNINIKISRPKNNLFLNYKDDGIGFDVNKVLLTSSGMGLNNIANRVKSLNGIFSLKSKKDMGVEICIEIEEVKN